MPKLPEFLQAENELDGNELVYIAQNSKTRKTTLQKIKEFVVGTATLLTTDKTPTGAINELKDGVDNLTESVSNNTAQLKEKANKNTEELVYYVSKNGNDNNDGLSADKPFLTINKAISKIPNFIANNITVNIADGTYYYNKR